MQTFGDDRPGSSTDALASTIGSYLLGEQLRDTRSGPVARATHVRTGLQVEIKILRDTDVDALADVRTRREVEALTRLSHSSLVRVYASGRDGGRAFLVIEHRTGQTLDEWIMENGPLPLTVAAEIHARILDGLAYCHANGVIHRDVSPASILLSDDGHAILRGFGLVKVVPETPTAAGDEADEWGASLMSDPALEDETNWPYHPPEFRSGAMTATSDVYSIGASLVFSLLGEVSTPAVVGLEQLPDAARDLVAQMLDPDPTRRPDAATASDWLRQL